MNRNELPSPSAPSHVAARGRLCAPACAGRRTGRRTRRAESSSFPLDGQRCCDIWPVFLDLFARSHDNRGAIRTAIA